MSEQTQPLTLDADRQGQAKTYANLSRRLMIVDLGLGALYLVVWVLAGWHIALREAIATITESRALAILLFAAVFGVIYMIIDLPLSYYSGFVLPHKFGQSNQTLRIWIMDQLKDLGLSAAIGTLALEAIYGLLNAAPNLWWLYAGGVILLFTVVLATLAPLIIMPLFYKFTPLDDEDLTRRLMSLAEKAGTRVKGVYRMDMSTRTKSANAAVMGLGTTRRIVLGDTLLAEFTPDEIETVLAHELAHLVHRDVPLMVAANSLLILASFWAAQQVLNWSVGMFGLTGIADPAGLPIFALTVGAIGLIAMPLGNTFSRWRESLADRYALETTGKPGAFADAMVRLANQNLGEYDPEKWVVMLLYSHPPLSERVEKARAFAVQHS